jgi:predicted RNase H-like HicB family nuclease
MNVLDHLIEEHRKAEQLIATLQSSEPGSTRASVLAELSDALDLHMEVEERDVYSIVQDHLGDAKADEAEHEHNEARELLARIADGLDDDDFPSMVESLKSAIQHHVTEEEGEIFPALRERAAEEIEALGDADELESEVEDELSEERSSR